MHDSAALSPARSNARRRAAMALAAVTATLALLAVASPAQAGGCDWRVGCGIAVNQTPRGFHVTLQWGQPWAEPWPVRWVRPWGVVGGGNVDVDGIYTGSGCVMTGIIEGRIPGYRYPFVWRAGWHKIWTNETAWIVTHVC
jgi:hypothetical protein